MMSRVGEPHRFPKYAMGIRIHVCNECCLVGAERADNNSETYCQNGGTTGGTQVACNLGGLRGLVVGRGFGRIKIMNTATLALYYLTLTVRINPTKMVTCTQ
jgi:hypothetical protein